MAWRTLVADAHIFVSCFGGSASDLRLLRERLEDLRTRHGWKRLLTEGHTVFDAVLTVAMAQIVRRRRCLKPLSHAL